MPETEPRTCPACGQSLEALKGLMIDPETLDVIIDGISIHLPRYQALLFDLLYRRAPSLVTPDAMMIVLYSDRLEEPNILITAVFVCKIRQRFKGTRVRIENVWGKGYRLRLEHEEN